MSSEPPPPDPASVVLTFLESVGRRSDAEFYLRLFRQVPKESFAVLAAEATALRYALPSLVDQLRFLRDLGLFAPVIVGLFEPKTADRAAARLLERCEKMNPVVHDVRHDDTVARVEAELKNEQLPIVNFGKLRAKDPEERFRVLGDLVAGLRSRKLVIVRRRGAFSYTGAPTGGASRAFQISSGKLSLVNLTTDFEPLAASGLGPEDLTLLTLLRTVLSRPDCRATVSSVTSPLGLLTELFTAKGAGTFIKRGSVIVRHASFAGIDIKRLRALLESSFERPLVSDFFERPPLAVYLEENYRGAAILAKASSAPLLTKFAVDRAAQGEGMGRDLWQALVHDHPSVFWRARIDNPIAGWYASLCDGMMRVPPWNVYFRGVSPEQVPALVRKAVEQPDDFG